MKKILIILLALLFVACCYTERPCDHCEGTGWTRITVYDDFGFIACRVCKGRGKY